MRYAHVDANSAGSVAQGRPVALPRYPMSFALLLTGIAGFLDAVGYVQLGHLYVSFMSGNSTHLGIAATSGAWPDVLLAIAVISAFVAGASAGTAVADAASGNLVTRVLRTELAVLIVGIILAYFSFGRLALILVALAMGMQNTMHQVIHGDDVGRSFITGALFKLGVSLARWCSHRADFGEVARNAQSWCAFVGVVVLGALAISVADLLLCLITIATLLAIMMAAVGLRWL